MTSSGRGAGRASLVLVLAAFLWGSTFLVVQDATDDAAVMPFLAARFLIGAAALWPLGVPAGRPPDRVA